MFEEQIINEENVSAELANGAIIESDGDFDEPETEIRDTDIVFDCPHCGHNLAIDYRGAGLQITCVNCGENVLVPIPDGMKIDDLDVEPGEILKQLFAARRNAQKSDMQIANLTEKLNEVTNERDELRAALNEIKLRIVEAQECHVKQAEMGQKAFSILESITGDIGDDGEEEEAFADEDAAVEDGTQLS